MIDSGIFPVTPLDGVVYVPALNLYLLCQDAAVDEQRLSRLQSELSRYCGGSIEFHPRNNEPWALRNLSNYHGEPIVWDYWELSRNERIHSVWVALHSRPLRYNTGIIEACAEKFLEHLAQEGIIDMAEFPSNPQVHQSKLPFYNWQMRIIIRENLYKVAIGRRTAHYIFQMRRYGKSILWRMFSAVIRLNPMSDLEIYKIVSENVEGDVLSVVRGPDSHALAKAVNEELRMKLGRKEFMRLRASFA